MKPNVDGAVIALDQLKALASILTSVDPAEVIEADWPLAWSIAYDLAGKARDVLEGVS